MNAGLEKSLALWDKQVFQTKRRIRENRSWIKLNNLYLDVERGDVKMSITVSQELLTLVCWAYPSYNEPMRDWWATEFMKLPGWLDY